MECFELLDTATFLVLPSSPLPVAGAGFLSGLQNRQAPFTYAASSVNGVFGINVYEVDPGTGLPSQPAAISQPFFQQSTQVSPAIASLGPSGGQNVVGPVLSPSALSLTFPDTVTGQKSTSQSITLTSSGDQAVSFQSVSITGANPADFVESDNCISAVLLQPKHSCSLFIIYAPTSVGPSQATLNVMDSALGNPQQYGLSGTGVAPPTPTPAVTLHPAVTFNLAGTTTQGTAAAPQNLTVLNSGTAPLHVTAGQRKRIERRRFFRGRIQLPVGRSGGGLKLRHTGDVRAPGDGDSLDDADHYGRRGEFAATGDDQRYGGHRSNDCRRRRRHPERIGRARVKRHSSLCKPCRARDSAGRWRSRVRERPRERTAARRT